MTCTILLQLALSTSRTKRTHMWLLEVKSCQVGSLANNKGEIKHDIFLDRSNKIRHKIRKWSIIQSRYNNFIRLITFKSKL